MYIICIGVIYQLHKIKKYITLPIQEKSNYILIVTTNVK